MENNEYATYTVEVLQHKIEYEPQYSEMVRTGREMDEWDIRTFVAPVGVLGRELIDVHFRVGQPHNGMKEWKITSMTPINTIIRYDDRYRGQV